MTWQWVTLLLGTFVLLFGAFGFVAWTNMKTQFYKSMERRGNLDTQDTEIKYPGRR